MTPGERYTTKRNNFIENTKKYFQFLISKFDYDGPTHTFNEQPNGTIISDKIKYEGQKTIVEIINAYHPNDYGFEIKLTNKQTGQTEMMLYVPKEKQDMEQSYLEGAAEFLKSRTQR